MSTTTILLIAIALGMDAFSMAVGIGVTGIRRRYILLVSSVVCIFHILMPLAGLTFGAFVGQAVGRLAGILGAAVLIIIGMKGLVPLASRRICAPPGGISISPPKMVAFGPLALVILAASVSLDALSVGFGLGALRINLIFTVLAFGTVAGLMTAGGFVFGRSMGNWLGDKADVAGALILLLIGVKLLLS